MEGQDNGISKNSNTSVWVLCSYVLSMLALWNRSSACVFAGLLNAFSSGWNIAMDCPSYPDTAHCGCEPSNNNLVAAHTPFDEQIIHPVAWIDKSNFCLGIPKIFTPIFMSSLVERCTQPSGISRGRDSLVCSPLAINRNIDQIIMLTLFIFARR